jgi:hypothetical protein
MPTSLILCTRNGGARLGTCLDHLAALDAPADFEIVLVDNGSDDGSSRQRLADFAAEPRHRARLVDCARPGNGAGRNEALKHARGELILFIDDDCYASPNFVRAWQQVFADRPLGYASGMIARHSPEQSWMGCQQYIYTWDVPAYGYPRRGLIQGSNMAFTRACLDAGGAFDERFGAGTPFAGEDWDLSLRAARAGFAGGYDPRPRVSHDHGRSVAEGEARDLVYCHGGGAVVAKHWRHSGPLVAARWGAHELARIRGNVARSQRFLQGFRDFRAQYPGPDRTEAAWQPA